MLWPRFKRQGEALGVSSPLRGVLGGKTTSCSPQKLLGWSCSCTFAFSHFCINRTGAISHGSYATWTSHFSVENMFCFMLLSWVKVCQVLCSRLHFLFYFVLTSFQTTTSSLCTIFTCVLLSTQPLIDLTCAPLPSFINGPCLPLSGVRLSSVFVKMLSSSDAASRNCSTTTNSFPLYSFFVPFEAFNASLQHFVQNELNGILQPSEHALH